MIFSSLLLFFNHLLPSNAPYYIVKVVMAVANMSILMECYSYSSMVVGAATQVFLLFSLIMRWFFLPWSSNFANSSLDETARAEATARQSIAAQAVKDSLPVLTYGQLLAGEKEAAAAGAAAATTCAVCLYEVRRLDSVRQLRRCRHVFHKRCLDRWLDHDENLTCPLCRSSLLVGCATSAAFAVGSEPSWAVEKLLYLFGDDLLFSYS